MDVIHLREIEMYANNNFIPLHQCIVVEYGNIVKVLRAHNWNQLQSARYLDISPRTLRYKVKVLRDAGMHIPQWERPITGVKQPKTDIKRERGQYIDRERCIPIDERIEMGECEPDDTEPRTFVRYEQWK